MHNILLVLMIAARLQGEAGVIGTPGYYAVGESMLARREAGQEWATVLSAYYGIDEPTSETIAIATRMVQAPWKSRGMMFCVNENDAARLGIDIQRWVCNNGYCVGLAKTWPTGG
jgi:hypothetical protein